jgi:hypothetical protein
MVPGCAEPLAEKMFWDTNAPFMGQGSKAISRITQVTLHSAFWADLMTGVLIERVGILTFVAPPSPAPTSA